MIVTLLTTTDCADCARAGVILDRLSAEVPFELRQISLNSARGQALASEHGVLFAPGVLTDGRLSSYGRPSERRLRRDLTAAQAHPR